MSVNPLEWESKLFERDFCEFGVHLAFELGEHVGEGGSPAQAARLDELPGE
jgi:hypothetical protein